ncbi:RrF2 family transcriptional regulator [Leadbettera azotonutricia]|uniref:Transcriptional regulator, BadM/Rrf2 family n=1 Tax=Leadbettera azotonutricia (strain ATCC BAA-888 / DSM 13862 / ZAS-9) TaxID=545695 RepID=F5YFY6_LEAAZ|nr:Rrf2 family transcriptional regulator [Leadbettera azotonutricia]AEF82345.1 transcriptional regulator, BadM/Rrf2 family [Leadbettera azotonutricia ZAS-9]
MKISTRGRYGIRLLIDLAEHSSEPHVSLASVAERQKISIRYLEQVAVILRRAGLIRSVKGASGGYALAKSPQDIIIGEALRMLEGDMLVVDPPLPGAKETKLQRCIRTTIFDRLNERIANVIDRKNLASVIGTVDPDESYMYFI